MPFPRKFETLIETELADLEVPDYVWLTYAVCALSPNACGWGGWMIEGAFKKAVEQHQNATGDKLLVAVDDQVCPRCRRETYRTGATIRLEPSKDQKPPLEPGVDYETVPIEFADCPDSDQCAGYGTL